MVGQTEKRMWIRKPPRPNPESPMGVPTADQSGPERPISEGSVADAPGGGNMQKTAGIGSALTVEAPGSRELQTTLLKPKRGQLARNLVIGPAAPRDVCWTYNTIRTQMIQRLRQNGWNTVAVTSPSRGAGTTLTAINLAISAARDLGQTVLLVELDFLNPSFHRIFGFKHRLGISDYLLGEAPLSEIVLNIGVERLAVIPAGSRVANSSELLSSPQMAQFVEELKGYERQIVLFDLPSVMAVDDAMAFAPLVDCALLVVDEGETRVNDVKRSLRRLETTKILGIALNRSIRGENEIGVISR